MGATSQVVVVEVSAVAATAGEGGRVVGNPKLYNLCTTPRQALSNPLRSSNSQIVDKTGSA